VPRLEWRNAVRLVVHAVALVAGGGGAVGLVELEVERLHAVDCPRVALADQKDCVKVHALVHHDARDNARLVGDAVRVVAVRKLCVLAVVGVVGVVGVLVSLLLLGNARLVGGECRVCHLQLRERKLRHVAHILGHGLALSALELKVEPLACGAKLPVVRDDHGHAKDGLL